MRLYVCCPVEGCGAFQKTMRWLRSWGVTVNGKRRCTGRFETALEAAQARDRYIHENGLVGVCTFSLPNEVLTDS